MRRLWILLALLVSLWPRVVAAQPPAVAVLYFDNQGNPALEPLKVGLAQMLITDLQGSAGSNYAVVERARLQAILDELELGHSGVVEAATAARVGKLLGAEWLLLGSYFELMGTLRVDARLVRVETGEIVHAHGASDSVDGFLRTQRQLAESFQVALADASRALGPASQPPAPPPPAPPLETRGEREATAPEASPAPGVVERDPAALAAAVSYSEGLMALDRKDVVRARESFEQALARKPDLALAQAELDALEL